MKKGGAGMASDLARALWRKSTRSNGSGACVEVARNIDGIVAVRDSKDPDGPALVVAPADWMAFTSAIKAGSLSS
jgi:uncharacterized protein DUF397